MGKANVVSGEPSLPKKSGDQTLDTLLFWLYHFRLATGGASQNRKAPCKGLGQQLSSFCFKQLSDWGPSSLPFPLGSQQPAESHYQPDAVGATCGPPRLPLDRRRLRAESLPLTT